MKSLKKAIGNLDADSAAKIVSMASDIAVVVDQNGVVRDLSIGSETLSKSSEVGSWIGQRWVDTVTVESRPKIEQLLKDAERRMPPQWRQVNHPSNGGKADLPVRYATMMVGGSGRIMAFGRELRSISLLQQKLVEAQQAMEREYARVRFAETRYRLLFQNSSEPVLIVDASNMRITEMNPAAQRLLGPTPKRIIGRALPELFDAAGANGAQRLIDQLRSGSKADPVTVKLHSDATSVELTGSLFRQESSAHLLLRLSPAGASNRIACSAPRQLSDLLEKMPDAIVVTDLDRKVLIANASFLEIAQLGTPEQAKGELVDRWLGRSPTEFNILLNNMREHGSVRNFPTVVRGELGIFEDVEVSAVAVEHGEQPCYGFTLRAVGRRAAMDGQGSHDLVQSVNQLKGLVGQVPLKNLVRETTDLIERMCIEAALRLVGDNRASAAEMLGLSRQSLYVKLRRYGLGDLDTE